MIKEQLNYSLKALNTFGLEVSAKKYVEYATIGELRQWLECCGSAAQEVLPVGEGSNLLFTGDFSGTVVHSCYNQLEVLEETSRRVLVRVGSGMHWDSLVDYAVDKGWGGVENLAGIPGQVGSAAVQNIGAYGADASQTISCVHTLDLRGRNQLFDNKECKYAYRDSRFKHEKGLFVTAVDFAFDKKRTPDLSYGNLASTVDALREQGHALSYVTVASAVRSIRSRALPDPKVLPNAGSFFKNPIVPSPFAETLKKEYPLLVSYPAGEGQVKLSAAWLIDRCDWKGKTYGGAAVDSHHALILVNSNSATGAEIYQLAHQIIHSVHSRFGVELSMEVQVL